eukprot:XP_001691435.1 predicted protein [Chlamydomonas reinhardtii]
MPCFYGLTIQQFLFNAEQNITVCASATPATLPSSIFPNSPAFSLFEAMSALEAGNPKMDAAASPAADRPTLDALLADLDLTAPLADLGAAGLLAVLDQLLAMEASWHTGSSAMQTVVKEHDSAVARALYAFCRSLQCECAAVRDLIIKGGVCEEEDMNLLEVVASAALFKEARELLPKIGESASLASPLPPQANGASLAPSTSSKPDTQQQQQHQLPRGFYVDANRHLLGPAPPRQVQIMSLADSLSYFDRLFDHLALAVVVSEQAWDYRSLQLHVWRFARLKPAVVARSMLHWLISPDRWQEVDMFLEQAVIAGPFSTWVEYETAATMLHHLLMGFELELYEPREYDMIVCRHREIPLHLQAQHRYELVELEAFQLMCSGLVRLLVGLRVAGSIPEPPFPPPFNGGAQRFDQRFGAFFTMVRPVPLSHAEFVESMNPGDRDASFLFSLASRAFAEARARCAALKTLAPSPEVAEGWVKGLDRAAALNQVVSGVLAAKAAAGGKIVWTSDFSHHPYFPAISLPKPTAAPAAAKEGAEKK